jgi:shikimate dehydrogenase
MSQQAMPVPTVDLYAVVGHPISHSRSPAIHAAFAELTQQHLRYEARLAPLDGFAETLATLQEEGCLGCNVTLPFKFEALALAQAHSPRARLAGAANTLVRRERGWWADNTDGAGLVRDLIQNAGQAIQGKRVLLIGAGGAAAGVLGPLLNAGPCTVTVANRSPDRAWALVEAHAPLAREREVELEVRALNSPGTAFDIVINASASSLAGVPSPVPATALAPGCLAVDLMYGAAAQGFLTWAEAHGARSRDGLGMLVEQAAEAFELWRGIRPETSGVLRQLALSVPGKAAP